MTEIPPGTITALGLGPAKSEDLDKINRDAHSSMKQSLWPLERELGMKFYASDTEGIGGTALCHS